MGIMYAPIQYSLIYIAQEGALLCNKILNDQHRGMSLTSDELQSLWEGRRRASIIRD